MLNPTSSQPDWLQSLQMGMQQVSAAGAAIKNAPDNASRLKAQQEFQARLKNVEEQGKTLMGLAWGNDEAARKSAQSWLPIQGQQAGQVYALNKAGADDEFGRQTGLMRTGGDEVRLTMGAGVKGAKELIGATAASTIDIEKNRLGHAWNVADRGLAHNDATNRMLFGSQSGLSALEQAFLYGRDSEERYYRNAQALAPTGLERLAGTLVPTLAAAGLLLG